MVSSVVPNAPGAAASGVDHRYVRPQPASQSREQSAPTDRIELSGASLAIARESARVAAQQVQQALAVGDDARELLVKAQSLLRAPNAGAQQELTAALAVFAQRVETAAAQGARLVIGEDVVIHAEPSAPPLIAQGADLRLKAAPGAEDIMQISADAAVDDAGVEQAIQRSLEGLQTAMGRLLEVARALEAHQGFIGAAERALASSVRHDLDTESARLMALQVRQGLEGLRGSVANAEPQAVLSLFRV